MSKQITDIKNYGGSRYILLPRDFPKVAYVVISRDVDKLIITPVKGVEI